MSARLRACSFAMAVALGCGGRDAETEPSASVPAAPAAPAAPTTASQVGQRFQSTVEFRAFVLQAYGVDLRELVLQFNGQDAFSPAVTLQVPSIERLARAQGLPSYMNRRFAGLERIRRPILERVQQAARCGDENPAPPLREDIPRWREQLGGLKLNLSRERWSKAGAGLQDCLGSLDAGMRHVRAVYTGGCEPALRLTRMLGGLANKCVGYFLYWEKVNHRASPEP